MSLKFASSHLVLHCIREPEKIFVDSSLQEGGHTDAH